ncbi:MAG: alpha-L-fucosidase [Candidatus Cyclobacteriaceae bacterium M3_2C_046]
MKIISTFIILVMVGCFYPLQAQDEVLNLNKPEREAWFTDLGFGLFIHWSVDVQYGLNISHNLRLASENYIDRYFNELPKTFNPVDFNPDQWAKMAKMAGMKYVVFTAKHHNGFCMWDTETTDFSMMHTPFGRDVVKEVIEAFREQGLAIGLYFSPDDFWFLHQQGNMITRNHPSSFASQNPELDAYDKKQLQELLTRYGQIDILFLDGNEQWGKTELAKLAWEINPDIVVTRGAMETPEQILPNQPLPSPWEACYTLTNSWSFRPTNEKYKTAEEVIQKWVEIRAKGGNFLLNAGPDPEGTIPDQQAGILNEVGAWWFINQEIFEQTKPFSKVKSASGYYFLQSKDEKDLYILIPGPFERFKWQETVIEGLKASNEAHISVLGQSDIINEADPDGERMSWDNREEGLYLKFMFTQNLYNQYRVDNFWANPLVIKITNYKL